MIHTEYRVLSIRQGFRYRWVVRREDWGIAIVSRHITDGYAFTKRGVQRKADRAITRDEDSNG